MPSQPQTTYTKNLGTFIQVLENRFLDYSDSLILLKARGMGFSNVCRNDFFF